MLRHIVLWKFKDEAEGVIKEDNLRKAKSLLESLPAKVSEIQSYEIGIDTLRTKTSYDLVLNSTFKDKRALLAYQSHPDHEMVVEFLRKVQIGKVVVDYEI